MLKSDQTNTINETYGKSVIFTDQPIPSKTRLMKVFFFILCFEVIYNDCYIICQ